MQTDTDVIVVGGGVAGLTSALHLSKCGLKVIVIEKDTLPRHRVCGEYISGEVDVYLTSLGASAEIMQNKLSVLSISTQAGARLDAPLDGGGFGISRYSFDEHLLHLGRNQGVKLITAKVGDVAFDAGQFTVTLPEQTLTARWVIGAYGKKSVLEEDGRSSSTFLGVKAHYNGVFEAGVVGLYLFEGGYCGVSQVENGMLNICYLTESKRFTPYKRLDEFEQSVVFKNQSLKKIVTSSDRLAKRIAISGVHFRKKALVDQHILRTGDAAGLIHPLCGNGIAMAIHAAKIAAEIVLENPYPSLEERHLAELRYTRLWRKTFSTRLAAGKLVSSVLRRPVLAQQAIKMGVCNAGIVKALVQITHGAKLSAV